MARKDATSMGGRNEAFPPTNPQQMAAAKTGDVARRQQAMGVILAQYWKPVYAYIHRMGRNNEESKDLTQGFFTEVVLGRELVQKNDPSKARFRAFLKTALRRYLHDVHKVRTAQKRMPPGGVVHLGGLDSPDLPELSHAATPDDAYELTWASQLLAEAVDDVRAACRRAGQDKHWDVFHRTVLAPILTGAAAPSLADLCRELDIESPKHASNMSITVRRQFRTVFEARVGELVSDESEIGGEIRDLMAILSRRAGS